MRLALPLMSLLTPLVVVALGARFSALQAQPVPPARVSGATLPMRVRVALEAAARARRSVRLP